jgi:hypothetical protein
LIGIDLLLPAPLFTSPIKFNKKQHTLPMADNTTTGNSSPNEHTMSATSRILSADATELPPNL